VNVSYSRISLQDLCTKVRLDNPESAEFVCAKAIRDGVIDATIDHAGKCVRSREAGDAYASAEPQAQFHKRITFCLDVHNEAVRAMRYPANAYKRDLEKAQRKGADDKTEEELAKEIEEEMEDEDGL
jgi:26S proteasome regulatory subunit N3